MSRLNFLLYVSFLVIAAICSAQSSADSISTDGTDAELFSFLLEATKNGDIDGIQRALDNGESIDEVNVNGWSAAAFAVAGTDLETLSFLIENGIDLNIANTEGYTPLMLAALQSDKEMVEVLLSNNADPTIATEAGLTAYSIAKESRRQVNAAIILEATALRGIYNDDVDLVLSSVRDGAYVNIRTTGGWNPLIWAAANDHLPAVQELISLGADVNHVENEGWSPLHFAALNGYAEITQALLAGGADTGIENYEGKTAKDIATDESIIATIAEAEKAQSRTDL